MKYDIVIVGAGPAGLSFARSLKGTGLKSLIVEKSPLDLIREPSPDGREIALTHFSVKLLKELGAWSRIPSTSISPIRYAKVLDGDSPYSLQFDRRTGDALGYLVPNHRIRRALWEEASDQKTLEFRTGVSVEGINTQMRGGSVRLSDGECCEAALIVAADSRHSECRREAGIGASMHDFGKTAIVCRMAHDEPHEQTAYECFHYGRTLAVLPMRGRLSSIVITVDNAQVEGIVTMPEDDFNHDVERRFGGRLGRMEIVGERHAYPLVAVHADRFVSNRLALIGDAAVGMHPVTAHGFNLGIRGQATLTAEIGAALSRHRDFGSMPVLKRYEARHMLATRPMYWGTNGIVGLFTDDRPPARLARRAVLRFANRFPPVKRIITNRLTELR